MSILNNSLLLGADAGAAGYQISRSLRFNSSDSAYLSRVFSSTGDRQKWTFSTWIKKTGNSYSIAGLFCAGTGSNTNYDGIIIGANNTDTLAVGFANSAGNANDGLVETTQVFRDPSSWYHIVVAADTTQATASNRLRFYVNGAEVTTFSSTSYPSQNYQFNFFNTATTHAIGCGAGSYLATRFFSGYYADTQFIGGQALTPSSFAETNITTGQWVPKAYTGSYGTNGFKLLFSNNASTTTISQDSSGNNNHWTANNISVTAGAGNDSLVDTPVSYGTDDFLGGSVRGNYCTLNPLNNGGITLSNGNLGWAGNGAGTKVSYGTVAVSSGKWYFEASINGATGGVNWECGIARVGTANNSRPGNTANGWQVGTSSTTTIFKINNNSITNIYTSGLTDGDILGVAFDVDNGGIWFARNGTWLEGSPSAGTGASFTNVSGTVAPFGGSDGSGPSSAMNFGQRPFAYTAPSGFKALCDTNLPAPVVAKPSTVMDVKLYTGNGSTQTISGLGFSPDLVWVKQRTSGASHVLVDTVRGAFKLSPNQTLAEVAGGAFYGSVSPTSDGFSLVQGSDTDPSYGGFWEVGANAKAYAAWAWDAGTSTVTNTQGSITSQVRANASAGFSVCTFTTQSSGTGTFGHGLNVAPSLVITKARAVANNWITYHASVGNTGALLLNSTAATDTQSFYWNNTTPTATVVTLGSGFAGSNSLVAYCFAPVAGYSAFGSYTGNGSSDGPFVYTGHRSRWVLIKRTDLTDSQSDWRIIDTARSTSNVSKGELYANLALAEDTSLNTFDILSNGFKIRNSINGYNANGGTYIWASFAEFPFQYARAR